MFSCILHFKYRTQTTYNNQKLCTLSHIANLRFVWLFLYTLYFTLFCINTMFPVSSIIFYSKCIVIGSSDDEPDDSMLSMMDDLQISNPDPGKYFSMQTFYSVFFCIKLVLIMRLIWIYYLQYTFFYRDTRTVFQHQTRFECRKAKAWGT